jgi:anti-sigma factor RsiW
MRPDCHAIRERFTDYLDCALPLGERAAVEAHAAHCADCRNALAMSREMVATLAAVRRPELPDGAILRLSERLATLPPAVPARARWTLPWRPGAGRLAGWGRVGAGMAAGVLLSLAFLGGGGHDPGPGPAVPPTVPVAATAPTPAAPVHVAMGSDAVVEVWFDAARPVDRVRFALELPAGVRMVSGGELLDRARLEWEGSLEAGHNVISIPVRGVARGNWTLTASIQRGGGRREQSVDLLVNGA